MPLADQSEAVVALTHARKTMAAALRRPLGERGDGTPVEAPYSYRCAADVIGSMVITEADADDLLSRIP